MDWSDRVGNCRALSKIDEQRFIFFSHGECVAMDSSFAFGIGFLNQADLLSASMLIILLGFGSSNCDIIDHAGLEIQGRNW